jgi:TsgA-like MFS transporter
VTTAVPKAPVTIIAIATYVIVSGIFTQSGVILGPAAHFFHTGVADTALLFAYLNAGNLCGIAVSLIAFPALTIRQVIVAAYALLFAGIALMNATHDLHVAFGAAVAIGTGAGTGLSAGAVILSRTFADRRRAIAFLGTDCAFSGAGYVVPSLVGLALAAGWRWQSGYLLIAVLPVLVLIAALRIRFPSVLGAAESLHVPAEPIKGSAYLRVGLFAAALAAYLTGQNVFTIWAPTVLATSFGIAALQAGGIVGMFFGASSFGLISAALLVTRVSPRTVLVCSMAAATGVTLLLAFTPTAGLFFGLTLIFGFTSTSMFKLMISIGSEQIPSSPPRLVTFLLLCAGLGGIAAPAISAPLVKADGAHPSLFLCCACYAAAFAFIIVALVVERRAQRGIATGIDASAAHGARR